MTRFTRVPLRLTRAACHRQPVEGRRGCGLNREPADGSDLDPKKETIANLPYVTSKLPTSNTLQHTRTTGGAARAGKAGLDWTLGRDAVVGGEGGYIEVVFV